MLHVGFTGTRHGLSDAQRVRIRELLDEDLRLDGFTSHHGDCVGADEEFHGICREPRGGPVRIVVHPGPGGDLRAHCTGDEVLDPMPYMKRNQAIVNASKVMIAAPLQDDPIVSALGSGHKAKIWGGTWRTIGMSRRALKRGLLKELYVIGRNGELLDHSGWPL